MVHTSKMIRIVALGALLAIPATIEAGPPLICQPFQTGGAEVLPWGDNSSWNTPDRRYDVQRLTADTMRLLSGKAPVIARMENLRRATIYAAQDGRVASELLSAVLARALTSAAAGSPDAAALFDAGYLIESYKQSAHMHRHGNVNADGYAFVTRALVLGGADAEMEFAASLMKEGAASAQHRRKALAGAPSGSLLARNLSR